MALGFQIALTGVAFVRARFGEGGVLPTAALLGLTDMDALTLAMSRLGTGQDLLRLGAQALAIGVISNTIVKLTVAVALGRGAFRVQAAAGLTGLGVVTGLALWGLG